MYGQLAYKREVPIELWADCQQHGRATRFVAPRIGGHFAQSEVETASGKSTDAEGTLYALHDLAKQDGYAVFDLKARLLLSRAEFQSGKRAIARAPPGKTSIRCPQQRFSSHCTPSFGIATTEDCRVPATLVVAEREFVATWQLPGIARRSRAAA
jgi:hypothetical protein